MFYHSLNPAKVFNCFCLFGFGIVFGVVCLLKIVESILADQKKYLSKLNPPKKQLQFTNVSNSQLGGSLSDIDENDTILENGTALLPGLLLCAFDFKTVALV